jgi:hypothetical protein
VANFPNLVISDFNWVQILGKDGLDYESICGVKNWDACVEDKSIFSTLAKISPEKVFDLYELNSAIRSLLPPKLDTREVTPLVTCEGVPRC